MVPKPIINGFPRIPLYGTGNEDGATWNSVVRSFRPKQRVNLVVPKDCKVCPVIPVRFCSIGSFTSISSLNEDTLMKFTSAPESTSNLIVGVTV